MEFGPPGIRRSAADLTLDRRAFLGAVAGLPLAAVAGCATHGDAQRQWIVDTHTHFYDPTRPQGVPWPPKDDAFLYRPVLPEEFKRTVRPLGVAGTVVVEASPWVEDNQWVLDLAAREPFLVGLVGHLKPGDPNFSRDLARLSANPLFRGIRTNLWGVKLEPDNSQFVRDLRQLAARDLALDLLAGPEECAAVSRLATTVPDLQFVIDHCAGVRVDGNSPAAEWVDAIRSVARHPNVHMKVSGLVEGTGRNAGAPVDVEFYRPALEVIWDAFGEDRVIFGSNWPVSARFADYPTVLQIVRDYFTSKGGRAAERYFRLNGQRVYRFS